MLGRMGIGGNDGSAKPPFSSECRLFPPFKTPCYYRRILFRAAALLNLASFQFPNSFLTAYRRGDVRL